MKQQHHSARVDSAARPARSRQFSAVLAAPGIVLLAGAAGIVAGALSVRIWTGTVRRWDDRAFWPQVARVSRLLLSDEGSFVAEYLRLLRALGRYLAVRLVALAGAVAPAAAAYLIAVRPFAATHELSPVSWLSDGDCGLIAGLCVGSFIGACWPRGTRS